MTAQDVRAVPGPVLVLVGPADDLLIAGLREVGLAPVAVDGGVVVWARRREPAPVAYTGGPLRTVADAALALGVSRGRVYELIGRGELAVVRVGSCTRVPVEGIAELLPHRATAGAGDGQVAR